MVKDFYLGGQHLSEWPNFWFGMFLDVKEPTNKVWFDLDNLLLKTLSVWQRPRLAISRYELCWGNGGWWLTCAKRPCSARVTSLARRILAISVTVIIIATESLYTRHGRLLHPMEAPTAQALAPRMVFARMNDMPKYDTQCGLGDQDGSSSNLISPTIAGERWIDLKASYFQKCEKLFVHIFWSGLKPPETKFKGKFQ